MKSTGNVIALGLTLLVGGTAMAGQHGLQPVPAVPAYGQAPLYAEPVAQYQAAPLFTRVKYKDHDEMAPCAVTKVIQVNDPCHRGGCCGPGCVSIQICVPGGACERIKVSRGGDRVRYDYGDYKVDVRVKKGYIEVDYQD